MAVITFDLITYWTLITVTVTFLHTNNVQCQSSLGKDNKLDLVVVNGVEDFKLVCPALPSLARFQSVIWTSEEEGEEGVVVASGLQYDSMKYTYLGSTGELVIKNVSPSMAGVYQCIVRLANGTLLTGQINLKVKILYAHFWEKEFKENAVRGGVAAALAFGTIASFCLVYSCRYRPGPTLSTIKSERRNRGHYNVALSMGSEEDPPKLSAITTPPSPPPLNARELNKHRYDYENRKVSDATTGTSDNMEIISQEVELEICHTPNHALHPIAPIASPEPSLSTISIGVNTDKPKPGSTIIYITAAE